MAEQEPKERRWQLALTSAEVRLVHDALGVWMSDYNDAPELEILDLRARLEKMGDVR